MKNKKLFAILTLVCFMFTLMPVAAFAGGPAEADMSYFVAQDGNKTYTEAKAAEGIKFDIILNDANGDVADTSKDLYVWAVDENGTVTSAMAAPVAGSYTAQPATALDNVYVFPTAGSCEAKIAFNRDGVYTVKAGFAKKGVQTVDSLAQINVLGDASVITVNGSSVNPDTYYATFNGKQLAANSTDKFAFPVAVVPNNVMSNEYTIAFDKNVGTKDAPEYKDLRNKTVTISTNSSAIEVDKETATTNSRGEVKFAVAASVEGVYEIDFAIDGVVWTVEVSVGSTSAAYIAFEKQPATPQAQYGVLADDKVTFAITDINGNVVDTTADGGMTGIAGNAGTGKYIVLTEKPAASNLVSEKLGLKYLNDGTWGITGIDKDAEGTYAVKVILDNGAFATATWEVKRFQTPVALIFDEAPSTVELGATFTPYLVYLDANNVAKVATDADLAVTGYAVADLNGYKVDVKTDEKYAGSVITLTGVSEKYDLVVTKEVKVAAEAVGIAFEDEALEVNVNNKVEWNVVDAEGNAVSLVNKYGTSAVKAEVSYVVLDKPADAKVSVTGANVINGFKGDGEMRLTSNKVGNVTVQAIVKVQFGTADKDSTVAKQTKYYTGTEIFAVGTADKGDVVVMSIGSNEIVINDAKGTIDAAPIVENNRTFVPFRALAEAFGATVAYDEATQAVTAELNGVTVVMTIGSAEYTVNGVAKTADVAPFINGSRTMVPVRFAAEAFGIKVIPTYDENGATADILFNL